MSETEDRLGAAMGDVKQAKALLSDANRAINAAQAERAELRRENERLAEPQLPDGVEWPRFEDGALVGIGDEADGDGEPMAVRGVTLYANDWGITLESEGTVAVLSGKNGERVKRPKPRVLDADGVPIEAGDVVYCDDDPEPLTAASHSEDGTAVTVMDDGGYCMVDAHRLSHRRPDSWEELSRDVSGHSPDEYCAKRGIDCHCGKGSAMAQDVLKRAKALAKAGE